MAKDTMIGVDLAKSVFQLHAASMTGEPRFRRKLSRQSFPQFMAEQAPAVVVMEACGSAHHWAREMIKLGHEVKLIAPRYVKPFVKRQKNDAADAEAIVIAAQRPEMRFVGPKSAEQQSRAVLFRARERLVHQRTELVNALRAALYEYGYVVPQGRRSSADHLVRKHPIPPIVRVPYPQSTPICARQEMEWSGTNWTQKPHIVKGLRHRTEGNRGLRKSRWRRGWDSNPRYRRR